MSTSIKNIENLMIINYHLFFILWVNSDYYNRAGRAVYACTMDLSKAFDHVSWEVLFSELLERGVSPLALRCLMFIYSKKKCNVR